MNKIRAPEKLAPGAILIVMKFEDGVCRENEKSEERIKKYAFLFQNSMIICLYYRNIRFARGIPDEKSVSPRGRVYVSDGH